MSLRTKKIVLMIAAIGLGANSFAATAAKPATEATKAVNSQVLKDLPFNDKTDFANAKKGFIARPETLTIKDSKGNVVWDLEAYKKYISEEFPAPASVNPSLYRNAQLSMNYGLYKVTDRIYQIRGFDMANMTLIQGDKGWIIYDTLLVPETAKAALAFANEKLGFRPVSAVIYSHSHVDHYGGVRGVATDEEVASGKVQIIAPEGFTEHTISENVTAGNTMSRRAVYMYGAMLPRNEFGGVNGGLGHTVPAGMPSLIIPTKYIQKTGEELTVDGVKMVFQLTPGTEAPAEMNTYFPQFKGLWMAENTVNTMHNILTLRGAQVRDAKQWAHYINESIEMFGDKTEVKFQSHHWPVWESANIVDYFKKQRDLYKYTHDQSVRMMNQGLTGEEISEEIKLPPELNNFWAGRGYYGTLRHNSRAVYQRYMGWYNGNPSDLNNLPPEAAGKKFVAYAGGEASVLKSAKADFAKGEYRWVATALKHVVFANPNNKEAKELLADAYEQLGYQAESGVWRAVYLQGAYELRNGLPTGIAANSASPDTIKAMTPEMLFDFFAVHILPEKAAGKKLAINMNFTDLKKNYTLNVENAVLNYTTVINAKPDVTVSLSKETLDKVQMGTTTLAKEIADGNIKFDGDQAAFTDFIGMLDTYKFWFNIVTP